MFLVISLIPWGDIITSAMKKNYFPSNHNFIASHQLGIMHIAMWMTMVPYVDGNNILKVVVKVVVVVAVAMIVVAD